MGNEWNERCKWCFSPLGTGDKVGVNNAGIGIFKKQRYIGLAKEILQNVIDAKDNNANEPVHACFEVIHISKSEVPGADRLSDVIKRCHDYYHEGDDGKKMALLKTASENLLDTDGLIPVLKISDYNTSGLTGAKQEKGSNWTGLVREISATNKGNGQSGSFGVGKFAPFNFSSLRTIIYSTYNKDNEFALQGKTILTTFKDEDGKLKQNVGLFGIVEEEDCKAIYDNQAIPDVFRRTEYGTDLFVLGFQEDEDWMKQIAVSVLEFFFYTIFKGNLEVSIIDRNERIDIKQNNLSELITVYENYCKEHEIEFSAPIYWNILNDTSGKTKHFKEVFRKKGNVELYLRVDPDFCEKRILQMRTAGMKIQEDTAFRIGAYFHGIFIATGEGSKSDEPKDNINSFLRRCENQAHDAWSKDEYEDNREEADKVLKAIHTWILSKIREEMPEIISEETAAFGLSDLLPNQESDGIEDQEEKAYAFFEPIPVDIVPASKKKNVRKVSDVTIVPKNPEDKKPVDIIIQDEDNEELSGGRQVQEPNPPHPPYPGPYPGPFPGPEPSPNPLPNPDGSESMSGKKEAQKETHTNKAILHNISISGIKTPYDSKNNTFRVSFMPSKAATDVYVRLRIGSDDEDKRTAKVKSAIYKGVGLELHKGYIKVPYIEKGEKVILIVELHSARRCPLEVAAYAE